MVLWCPVGVSVLCVVTDPASQSNGQPYSEACGHRVLIFTQLTKVLDIFEIFLNFHGYRYYAWTAQRRSRIGNTLPSGLTPMSGSLHSSMKKKEKKGRACFGLVAEVTRR
jgi:hypothetical protein